MEVVYSDKGPPSIACSIDLQGLPLERYKVFHSLLKPAFQDMQIAVILEPYAQAGLFGDEAAMSEVAEISAQLCNFWNQKVWDIDTSDAFQTLILTRPELEGAKIVFMAHPAFSQLMNMTETSQSSLQIRSGDGMTLRRGGLVLKPFEPNDNNTPASRFSSDKGKEDEDDYLEAKSDEELIVIPRPSTRVVRCEPKKRKFKIYTSEVLDREEIEFVSTEDFEGILYVLCLEANQFSIARIGLAFDLIHSVYSDESCIVRVLSSLSGNYESEGWVKEIVVQAHVWTNVCEKLLPCNPNLFPIVFSIISLEPDSETPSIKVKGVRLSPHEKNRNIDYIRSDDFQPYNYGFCQNF
jgi:hypothetical protein